MLAAHHNARNMPLQLVACSATVGRPMRRDLAQIDNAWGMSAFEIVRATVEESMTDEARREMKSARTFDRNNGPVAAGALVPQTISHQFVSVRREEDKYAMLQYLLTAVCPTQPALLFLSDQLSVRDMVQKMRYSGIPRAQALHEALGFHSFDAVNATASAEGAAAAPESGSVCACACTCVRV
jgi:hypothetical protein